MMLGIVVSDGKKVDPHWFEKGVEVNTEEYIKVLETVVEPWLAKNWYVFQQDLQVLPTSSGGHAGRTGWPL